MIQFHETMMGRRFFEGTLPELVSSINKLTKEVKRLADMKDANTSGKDMNTLTVEIENGTSIIIETSANTINEAVTAIMNRGQIHIEPEPRIVQMELKDSQGYVIEWKEEHD